MSDFNYNIIQVDDGNTSVDSKNIGGINIIQLIGYLDAHTAPLLEDCLSSLTNQKKYKVVVDFSELKYISSAGLGVFMAFIEVFRENGGDIKLCNMLPSVFTIFDLLGFPLLYDFATDTQDAINKFKNNSENK